MADTANPGQPGGSSAGTGTPAGGAAPPTPSPKAAHDARQAAQIERAKAASVFGTPNLEPDPFTAVEDDQSASAPDPSSSEGRQPGGAEAAEQGQAGKDGQPVTKAPAGDEEAGKDILDQFAQFEPPADAGAKPGEDGRGSPTQTFEPLDSEEKIAKAINPTGTATLEEQHKNAKSLIGVQGRQLGDARQQVRAYKELEAQLQGKFVFDPKRNMAVPTPQGLIELAESIPIDVLNPLLIEQRGLRLVPADYKGEIDQAQADEEAVAKELVPADMTHDERMAEIDASAEMRRKFDRQVRQRDIARETAKSEDAAKRRLAVQQEQQRMQQEEARADAFYKQSYGELKKLPYYAQELKPLMDRWMGLLLKQAPDMDRELRFKLALGQAQLARTRKEMKRYGDARVEAHKRTFADAMAGGGVDHRAPSAWVDQPESQDAHLAAEHRKAQASMDALAKAIS